jgi:hypothetical protein
MPSKSSKRAGEENPAKGAPSLPTEAPESSTYDPVQESSEESFPASDAPSWAMGEDPDERRAREVNTPNESKR